MNKVQALPPRRLGRVESGIPFCTRSMLMGANNGRVHEVNLPIELPLMIGFFLHGLQYTVPDAGLTLAVEVQVHATGLPLLPPFDTIQAVRQMTSQQRERIVYAHESVVNK